MADGATAHHCKRGFRASYVFLVMVSPFADFLRRPWISVRNLSRPSWGPGANGDNDQSVRRALLLTIDPLAALAETQGQIHARLMELTSTASDELRAAWESARAQADVLAQEKGRWPGVKVVPEQYLVLVTCRDERHQVELLGRFQGEGLECRALLS
jgi:hypothetical protein